MGEQPPVGTRYYSASEQLFNNTGKGLLCMEFLLFNVREWGHAIYSFYLSVTKPCLGVALSLCTIQLTLPASQVICCNS